MYKFKFTFLVGLFISYMFILTACGDKAADISILATSDSFVQSTAINNKVDILWVIDSSGSMAEEQQNLADNFSAFISRFVTKGYDYHMAVTATDAWRREFNQSSYGYLAKFRDGNIYTGTTSDNSGIFMISPLTSNIIDTFRTNIKVGITGSGDERAFDSIKQTLINTDNDPYNFRRTDAFLAVVIVSDEDDFSRNSSGIVGCDHSTCTNLRTIDSYKDFLDTYTGSVATDRKYNVSTITIIPGDTACMAANPSSGGNYGIRHVQLANETNGVVGNLCDTNFSNSLDEISGRIAELSTQFRLAREPIVSSIVVHVNGVLIPNNSVNGWTYNPVNNSVVFHGSAVPPQGADIQIYYDPTTLT